MLCNGINVSKYSHILQCVFQPDLQGEQPARGTQSGENIEGQWSKKRHTGGQLEKKYEKVTVCTYWSVTHIKVARLNHEARQKSFIKIKPTKLSEDLNIKS